MSTRSRGALHRYQEDASQALRLASGRQAVCLMGGGKTVITLTALVDLQSAGLLNGPVLCIAPLAVAESTWHAEAAAWEHTRHLRVERVLGTPKQRLAALLRSADVYVSNYDNLRWLMAEITRRHLRFSVLIADEASNLKNPDAQRTRLMVQLGQQSPRRWALTGTPRNHTLLDVWGPAQFVQQGLAFPSFYPWRDAHFFSTDLYQRHWIPKQASESAIISKVREFTHVVDREALSTRPPVAEIVHDVPLPDDVATLYDELDSGGTTASVARLAAAGVPTISEMAIVGRLMQVCSGALYTNTAAGAFNRLHDRRLDRLSDIHEGHSRPTLVFVTYRHEATRLRERFSFARELTADLLDAWNAGDVEMAYAHPASMGHGINAQGGSNVLCWFSLPWSAELYAQANARLARQGQRETVSIHVLLSRGRIDEIAHHVVHHRLEEQERLIEALA
jgi:SNF2-related domain